MTHMNRRRLMQSGAAIAALGSLGACAGETGEDAAPAAPVAADTPPPETAPSAYAARPVPDGLAQLEMLANGSATSLSLTQAAIERSKAAHPLINAVATESYEKALEASATPQEGTFGGVPTFIKDLLDWQGDQTL